MGKNIILEGVNRDDLSTKRYLKVQPIYKVGCRACDTPEFTSSLCDECKVKSESVDAQFFLEQVNRIEEKMYPSDKLITGKKVDKRTHSVTINEDDDHSSKAKSLRGEN